MKKLLLMSAMIAAMTTQAQTIVKNINPGSGASYPYPLATLPNGKTILYANDGTNGYEIWATDGTTAGTTMVVDINQTPGTGSLVDFGTTVYNGKFYFCANDGTNGYELWYTDGTAAGTGMVKNIGATNTNGFTATQIIIFNNKMYFRANEATTGSELWESDGTDAGTQIVKNINPGNVSSSPGNFYVFAGKLYFTANDGTNGTELWVSDGTTSGTKMVDDLNPGANSGVSSAFQEYNGWLYFQGVANTNDANELFRTDGTTIEMVKNINPTASAGSNPADFMVAGGTLYFIANDGVNGQELWKTDGTTAGTVIVKNINSGSTGTSMFLVGESKGKLLFVANDPTNGNELWTSDGTAIGTSLLVDINTGTGAGVSTISSEYYPKYYYRYFANNYMRFGTYYFAGNDGTNGTELWKSDGSAAGTVMLNQIAPSTASANVAWIFVDNANVWINATDGSVGQELYKYSIPNASVEKIKLIRTLAIKPNPAKDQVTVEEKGRFTITDMQGRTVSEGYNDGAFIDISALSNGIYTITLVNETGKTFAASLVKE